MNNVYVTVLSAPYLLRALALHASVMKHCHAARFVFCCMDGSTATALKLLNLERSSVYREEEFGGASLLAVRGQRPAREYCWTAKPFSLCHVLDTVPDLEWAVFVDADTLAFGDLDLAIEQAGQADFILTQHWFSDQFKSLEPTVGRYNSGYLACRANPGGKAAAAKWRELCLQGSPVIPTDGIYGDQKHLELVAELGNGAVSDHIGLNAAPWNIEQYRVTKNSGQVYVDDFPLLLFHFQSFRMLSRNLFDLYPGELKLEKRVRQLIYLPYLEALSRAWALMRVLVPFVKVENTELFLPPIRALLSYTKRFVLGRANICYFSMIYSRYEKLDLSTWYGADPFRMYTPKRGKLALAALSVYGAIMYGLGFLLDRLYSCFEDEIR